MSNKKARKFVVYMMIFAILASTFLLGLSMFM